MAARDDLRDTDKRETRILIQTHPDVLIVPPDPPQLLIKLGQVRQAIHVAYYRPPVEARRAFTIFTSSAFMKEAANSLLKLLEEPPDAHLADPAHGKSRRSCCPPSAPAPWFTAWARCPRRNLKRCWPTAGRS